MPVAKYLFLLQAETRIQLPPYKGSAFHGGFGHALKKISSFYFREIFEPGKDGAWPKPFVLLPPLDTDTIYQPGRKFTCELTLFGNAANHFSICHAALEFLGREMGFGNNRGKFSIRGVETARPPTRAKPPDLVNAVISGREIAAARLTDFTGTRITLHLPTRLRLKADGRLLRQAPPFNIFFARLLGRLNTLATTYGTGKLTTREQRDSLLNQAKHIKIADNQTAWQDLPRYSGRQKSWMKFGGLLGSITYEGDLQPFLPYLALGEWTHTGGKTSFGLGKYVMEENEHGKT
jgi:hypothetical protein